jgi:hypothetical protein
MISGYDLKLQFLSLKLTQKLLKPRFIYSDVILKQIPYIALIPVLYLLTNAASMLGTTARMSIDIKKDSYPFFPVLYIVQK